MVAEGSLIKPHGITVESMIRHGILKSYSRGKGYTNTKVVPLNEMFYWRSNIYILKESNNKSYPILYRVVNWKCDIKVVVKKYDKVGILFGNAKMVIPNYDYIFDEVTVDDENLVKEKYNLM
jgi:hypothetical protein